LLSFNCIGYLFETKFISLSIENINTNNISIIDIGINNLIIFICISQFFI